MSSFRRSAAETTLVDPASSPGGARRRVAWCLVPLSLLLGCSSPTASQQGCTKDTDCKDSRVCISGACSERPATSEPARTAAASQAQATATATATPTATATAAATSEGAPRLLAAAEQADVNKVLAKFTVDYKQSFHLTLNGFGECVFASTTYDENHVGDFLVVAGGKTYALPKSADTKAWTRDHVRGVWFGKLDKDDLTDVITIADYMTGAGPTGAQPFPVVQYFYGSGPKTFRLEEALSKKATDKGITTVVAARDFANGKLVENPCTGDGANSELPCTLKTGLTGWCKGGACKAICPAGYSYDPLDTQCHQPRDCKASASADGVLKAVKTAKCNECMGSSCFDAAATRPIPD